jgi:hypothetical protein
MGMRAACAGAKASVNPEALRGAEAPLFHVTARRTSIAEFQV